MKQPEKWTPDRDDYLAALHRATRDARAAEHDKTVFVEKLRKMGTPWESIAAVLGVSKQAAWGKYGERSS